MEPLRYGVIGTGMMGVEHIHNLSAVDGAIVTAIADPHPPSRDEALAALEDSGPVSVYEDHRDLLESGTCDAVVIASPNMTHAEVLLDVLAHDRYHVLVEKPLCTTVQDCMRVRDAARDHRGLVWVGLEYRYMPPIAALVDEVRAGTVGGVRMISVREHRFPFLRKVGDWNRFNRNTGGTLVEKACHFFDLMNLIAAARPVTVMASGAQDVNHLEERYEGETPDILDNAFVIVDYDNGVRAMLDLCMFAEATHNMEEVVVVGDAGKVEALLPESALRVGRRGEHFIGGVESRVVTDETIAYEGFHHGSSYREHVDFLAAIRSGAKPAVGVEEGSMSVAVGAAAHLSIDEGRVVEMAELLR